MHFEHLVDKWALLVVIALTGHPTRFNQLGRAIGGVFQNGLSQAPRRLERDGVVCRVVIATAPVAVEYSLTALGRTPADAITPFATWAVIHADAVSSARLRHDADSP
ncbi:helix-turn-helix domain-containing protein [Burkholderia contaminans]|uniref:Transcriptional regulator n=1 Tax=Burkholderia contaminans TaxID=488447 RepID=A0A3N8PTI6_9BURK|nr:helix-turn-helix domain-containing protein [Burkholderia contaminans]RQT14881.1 transcriptional regulator [Burkholderia contaminans]